MNFARQNFTGRNNAGRNGACWNSDGRNVLGWDRAFRNRAWRSLAWRNLAGSVARSLRSTGARDVKNYSRAFAARGGAGTLLGYESQAEEQGIGDGQDFAIRPMF